MANASKFLEEIEKLKKKKKEQGEDTSSLDPIAPVKPDLSFSPQVNSFFEALNTEQEKLRRREEIANSYDIAPTVGSVSGTKHGGGGGSFTVKSEEDDSLLDFFDAGAFRDGYQIGDISKTILGTVGDIGVGAVKGVAKTGGGLIDAAQYGAAAVADAFGGDEWADKVRKNAQRTVVDDAFAPVADYLDKYSVLGRTLNSTTEAVGQIGAILATGGLAGAAGLGSVGASAATMGVMGLSSFGSSTGEAYKGGAETGEAELYGAIAGTADAITELLSGGLGKGVKMVGLSHGLGGFDDIVAKKVSEKISNTIAKNAVQFGVKASGEGLEEVLAGTVQAAAKYKVYMEEQGADFSQILEDENLLEQFVVGAMASGVAQVPSVAQANKAGADYVTGRTKNEQAVIDRVVEQRIKDAETDAGGVKLKPKQRQDIEEQVVSDMERGRIEIDTIEEVLGGEEYKAYQDAVKEEDALRKEYEELGALKEPTLAEQTRYKELHEKASEFSSDERRTALKKKLSEHVAVVAQGDRLSESYAERARRKEYFAEDVSKYKSDAAKKTVQNLIDSKVANNTNRTRELAETVAKIAEDKGIVFNFTNNKKLRESGKAGTVAEGVIINGFKDADGITINLDSPKAWDFIVGHEVTHALEGTAEYTALADAVKVYAQTKGEYDSRKTAITSLYAEGTDVDSELTADMVGELFHDEQFVSDLSVKHQNVFQKVFAEIKHLVKMVTAGSKEARQLEQVKRTFEKAYRAAQEQQAQAGSEYSLERVDGTDYVRAEKNLFVKEDGTLASEREVFKSLVGKKIQTADGEVEIVSRLPGKDMYNELSRRYPKSLGGVSDVKQVNTDVNYNMEELLETSEMKNANEPDKGGRHAAQGIVGFDTRTVKFYDGSRAYDVEFSIATLQDGRKVAYAKKFFGYDAELTKKIQIAESRSNQSPFDQQSVSDDDIISQNTENVNRQFSLTKDTQGRELTAEQREYFRESKVTDENGNLKVMYHGTQGGGFHVFDPAVSDDGISLFFTDRNEVAMSYSGTSETYAARTFRTADDFNVFFEEIGAREYSAAQENGRFVLYEDGDEIAASDTADGLYEEFRDWSGLGSGDVNYEVYLNLTHPFEMDADGHMWNELPKSQFRRAAHIKADDYEVKRVGDEFRLYRKSDGEEMPDGKMQVNENNVNLDPNYVRDIIVGKVNMILDIKTDTRLTTRYVAKWAKEAGYDGVIFKNIEDSGMYSSGDGPGTVAVAFSSEQVKSRANDMPTSDPDIRFSLSNASAPVGGRGVAARDLLYQGEEMQEAAPVRQTAEAVPQMQQDAPIMVDDEPVTDDVAPIPGEHSEFDRLNAEYDAVRAEFDALSADVQSRYAEMSPAEQEQAMADVLAAGERLQAAHDALMAEQQSALASYTDADVPPEVDAPYYGEEDALPMPDDPMADRDEKEVGNRSVKAYQYLNPEVKPYFREEANAMLGDLRRATRGERFVTWDTAGNEAKWTGVERTLAYDLAGLKDRFGYSYEQLEKGIQAIIDDDGKENNAVSKRIELLIHDRLAKGYVDAYSGIEIPANEEYLDFLREKQITEYNDAAFDSLMADAESLIPPAEDVDDVAPVAETGRVQEAAFDVDAPIYEDADDMDGGETIAAEIPTEEDTATDDGHIRTVRERLEAKLRNFETELENNKRLRVEASAEYDRQIAELETAYEALPNKATKKANAMQRRIERLVRFKGNNDADYAKRIFDLEERVAKVSAEIKSGESPTEQANMRRELHANIVENIRNNFEVRGYDMDEVFKGAKNLATFSTVDNTPQRVMEKALGYKQGQILADLTVNKTAQHETEGIRWLNQFTDRKKGLLAQISRQYNIKPGSKESAAAQMYAEGFYVSKHDEIIKYGDAELAADFPDAKVQANIKGLARDGRIRAIYDATLDAINASRVRNAYPAIQKLDNYFLHFRAMEDTFSRIGLPFNPNDIRAMDLPTDLNGVTADLKPGQPYFASAQHRRGKRTSFDLLGGLEKYLSSAKNQIYHIDDIQTLRALRNQIVDTYGQSKGLQSLDELTEEEVQERIKEVFGSHLSTFASFLNEEANHIAGKKALIDRGLEGMLGRRALTFMSDLNRQVGSNMVGYNISSALTNFIAPVQAFAKMNKAAFVKGFAQTVSNRIGGIFGRGDTFVEDSSVMVRREGEQRFHRTAWQRMSDPGYALMGAIDSISTEIVARAKYNELTAKGMTSEQAHYETDKYVSRLMGDRSLGQQPLLFNSKTLGMITKFQLEVRNQMDAQFYDTVKEAEVSTENIENAAKRNAVKAAKITSTFVQLAVGQHLFGKVFESIAGYNPTFDIIEAIVKAAGWDDDEEDDDTMLDNIEQSVLSLLEDLPYSSVLTGGRVPIESALPIAQFVKGKDSYGNEKSRLETLAEAAPYYVLPGGYGQIKKTAAGLGMYSDEHPVAGSYTDSGNLRFPVGTEPLDVAQAAVFGQWSSGNARDYFDDERKPLSPKQVDEYAAADMTIQDYWRYRDGLKEHDSLSDQAEYINSLDIPAWKKNLFINNISERKEAIDMTDFDKYGSLDEMDFAKKYPEKYKLLQEQGVPYYQYETFDDKTKDAYGWAAKNPEKYNFIRDIGYTVDDYAKATDTEKDAFTWAYNNPDKYLVSRAVSDDLMSYRSYTKDIDDIPSDKNANGNSIPNSRKPKVVEYLNGLDIDYGAKIILYKREFPGDDTYDDDIIDYLNEREDISAADMTVILKELGFKVSDDGAVARD